MKDTINEFDSLFILLKDWTRKNKVEITDAQLVLATACLGIWFIERKGWANRKEELERANRVAQAAKDAIVKEFIDG